MKNTQSQQEARTAIARQFPLAFEFLEMEVGILRTSKPAGEPGDENRGQTSRFRRVRECSPENCHCGNSCGHNIVLREKNGVGDLIKADLIKAMKGNGAIQRLGRAFPDLGFACQNGDRPFVGVIAINRAVAETCLANQLRKDAEATTANQSPAVEAAKE